MCIKCVWVSRHSQLVVAISANKVVAFTPLVVPQIHFPAKCRNDALYWSPIVISFLPT